MFLARRPHESEIADFLSRQAGSDLTYEPVGLSELTLPGYRVDEHRARVGQGTRALEQAKEALDNWAPFQLRWVEFHPSAASSEVGANVAILVRHLGFWSLNGCRVVGRFPVGPDDGRYGFFYGTLQDHAESGEEAFAVELDPYDGSVWYQIRAVSRPRAVLAQVGYPLSRRFQRKFRDDSMKLMERILRDSE